MNAASYHGGTARYAHDDAKHEFFASIVARCADAVVAAVGERNLAALFMTGAPARGEATIVETSSGLYSLSDVDLVCVAKPDIDLAAARADAASAVARLNRELADRCVGVDASVKRGGREGDLAPFISNYEFVRTPVLLFGSQGTRETLGSVDIDRIPASDALRFVHNRCVERLIAERGAPPLERTSGSPDSRGADGGADKRDEELTELRALYGTAKLMLDLVTAFLFVRRDVPLRYPDRVRLFIDEYCTRSEFGALTGEIAPVLDELRIWADFKTSGDVVALRRGLSPEALAGANVARFAFAMWRQVLGDVCGEDLSQAPLPRAVERFAALESRARSLVRSLKMLRDPQGREVFSAGRVLRGALLASPVARSYIVGLTLFFTGLGKKSLSHGARESLAARAVGYEILAASPQWTRATLARYSAFDLRGGIDSLSDAEMRAFLLDGLTLFHERILLGRSPSEAGGMREAKPK